MKVLVTGGAGYIGSITTKKLIEDGHDVVVYDSLIKGYRESIDSRAIFVEGCLSDGNLLDVVLKKYNIEAVLHFAGFIEAGESMKREYASEFFKNNVENGRNLLDAMFKNGVKKIVYSSSAAVYNAKDEPLKEEDLLCPDNFYGETKLAFENLLKWYDKIYDIKSISLRYFNATGSWNGLGERHNPETHLIPLTIQTALGKRDKINIFGTNYNTKDGTCIRDYVHVKDLANAHSLALNNIEEMPGVYNVGTGNGKSVREVIDSVKEITGKDFQVLEQDRRKGDPAVLIADPNKINTVFGWKPKISFEEGLKDSIKFFENNQK